MKFFDFLRPKPTPGNAPTPPPAPAKPPIDRIFAVPVSARPFTTTGAIPKEKYVFYSFLFADSTEAAVARVRKELRDESFEFIGVAGQVLITTIPDWPDFVADRFDWIKEALPTAQQIAEGSRGLVYYTPKIIQF